MVRGMYKNVLLEGTKKPRFSKHLESPTFSLSRCTYMTQIASK